MAQPQTAPTVVVRPGGEADLPAVAAIYTHFTLKTTVTFNTHVRTPADWLERYRANVVEGPYHLLVAEVGGAVTGYVETGPFRPHNAYGRTVETSIYVAPDGSGQGVGGALYTRLFDELSSTSLHRAIAVIALPNDSSCRFHERHGFVHRGTLTAVGRKFNRWLDTAYYERALSSSDERALSSSDERALSSSDERALSSSDERALSSTGASDTGTVR